VHEDPRSKRGDRIGPNWAWAGRPRPAGLAQFWHRFGPVFLALEGSSTIKPRGAANTGKRIHSHQKAIHKREREEEDLRLEINHLEGSTLSWRRRKTPAEGNHDQRCHDQHLDGVIFSFVHGL
jgi:hypothetical protein